MNKNLLFLAVALLTAFVVFKVVKGEETTPAQATVEALPAMPTPPTETAPVSVPAETKEEATPAATNPEATEPQMTQEEFEALIQELVKAAEQEKKAKDASAKATQPASSSCAEATADKVETTTPVEAPAAETVA